MVTQPHLILASASPRRTELLKQIGIPHEVVPANVVEEAPFPMSPHEYVRYLSQKKARAITIDGVILAADTVVAIDDMILEKPADSSEARAMLARLSGRAHEVVTGVTIRFGEKEETFDVTTHVRFGALLNEWIEGYIATNEPYDKAGGYGIQAMGGLFVEAIEGDYYNVVGLPIHEITKRLASFKIKPMFA
ncbi:MULTISPECIES: Maf family protein [Exiguobacterium]|uniref:dTTP/UTP pyrophosphatase n=1 Tax=Exiguobacterium indicum TaxID=296995 RepID=A0AAW3MBW0_9BACL|nr:MULTISPECIES: Maf family protein [Exiguobacterium]AHA30340.1 septum formation inhibitor Maf [Exiguobacterium sp. MH3]KTR26273.1 septum formation inhibitor Maf [Exiguobacterium indicum]MCQ4089650.1 Maf family protein [Exiguobacterium sp. LL15]NTY10158.1 septum formation protein Maf [Exiguobacterium sp. JMULE1]